MEGYLQYQEFLKPEWAPPSWVFGPVWTILYILIALSFGYVAYLFFFQRGNVPRGNGKKITPFLILPFFLNLFFNAAFTPLQFGLQNNLLASIDILLILATLLWALVAIFPLIRWVALINIPYLLWVSFATVLQITITVLNR